MVTHDRFLEDAVAIRPARGRLLNQRKNGQGGGQINKSQRGADSSQD